MRRRRNTLAFNLAFLDVMACGFGAIILLYVIIDHQTVVRKENLNKTLQGEVEKLDKEVAEGRKYLVELKNTIEETDEVVDETSGLSARVINVLEQQKTELAEQEKDTLAKQAHINQLKADIKSVEEETKRLKAGAVQNESQGERLISFVGDGQRQYVTGLQIGGEHLVILLDSSASMLADTIVNVIITRNKSNADKVRAAKWQRAVNTVEWISTRIPPDSKFQIVTFNETVTPVGLSGTLRWLDGGNPEHLRAAVGGIRSTIPEKGTSLENAFAYLQRLTPKPDNVYLITDGLPTQGKTRPRSNTVNARGRVRHFNKAKDVLRNRIPISVVLFPMEGDPDAASLYWLLAAETRGAFFSPSYDWP